MLKKLISYLFLISPILISSFYIPNKYIEPNDFPLFLMFLLIILYLSFTIYFYLKNEIYLSFVMNILFLLGVFSSIIYYFINKGVFLSSILLFSFIYLAIFYNFNTFFSKRVIFLSSIVFILYFIILTFLIYSTELFGFLKYLIYPSVYKGINFVPFLFLFLAILGSVLSKFEIFELNTFNEKLRLKISHLTIFLALILSIIFFFANFNLLKSKYYFNLSIKELQKNSLDKALFYIDNSLDLKEDKDKYIQKINILTKQIENTLNQDNLDNINNNLKDLFEKQFNIIKRLNDLYKEDKDVLLIAFYVYKNSIIITGESGYQMSLNILQKLKNINYNSKDIQKLEKELKQDFDLIFNKS